MASRMLVAINRFFSENLHNWSLMVVLWLFSYSVLRCEATTVHEVGLVLMALFGTIGAVHGSKEVAKTMKGNGVPTPPPPAYPKRPDVPADS